MELVNQVALVTGSATGIGRATVLALARLGAAVVVNYTKSEPEARETIAAIEELGRRALLVKADVSDDRQARALVERTVGAFGRLDVLVNNAGATTFVDFHDLEGLTDEIWDRSYAVNVKGTFYCSRAAAGIMQQRGGGCIVNVTSVAGLKPAGSSIAYCAAKAAAISLTQTLAVALAPTIRVNAVAPGFIDTRWNPADPALRLRAQERAVLKRAGRPEDVAEVIVGLITNSHFVTGQVVVVDGGQLP